jgi:dsDNA-specific endonuclease/ATPase MutS2
MTSILIVQFMSNDTNIAVITGPNMSGKTTYLKQVATLQVLAQVSQSPVYVVEAGKGCTYH